MENTKDLNSLVDQANRSQISTIASVVTRIIAVINDPEATAKELVDIILTDPPLAANVLRLVNSAHYAPRRKIADIQQAVIFIGFDALKELALNQKVCEIFQKAVNIEGYTRQALWRHSVAVAQFAKMIYRREFAERGENVYAVGLLHDLGIIVADQFRNNAFMEALRAVNKEDLPLWQAEQRILGYDHSRVGARLLAGWNLPDEIVHGVEYHHTPDEAPDDYHKLAASLFVANHCCQTAAIGFCDSALENETLYNQCIERLAIEPDAIELITTDVQTLIHEMIEQGLL
ncbi:MAG: HDOD domain-containing protein [Desulfobacterales bacterium]|nr:HDOD domain-containing protein [Desulfobacterales bacterium]